MKAISILLLLTATAAAQCGNLRCRMCYPRGAVYQKQNPVLRYLAVPHFESSPPEAVNLMLRALELEEDDVLYDLGCGDGRILVAAVRRYGCRAVGIEIDPQIAAHAREKLKAAPDVASRIRIVVGDVRKFDLSKATAVAMYLDPKLVAELSPKLIGTRVASYQHDIMSRLTVRLEKNGHIIYVGADK